MGLRFTKLICNFVAIMKNVIKNLVLVSTFSMVLFACEDDDKNPKDLEKPTISLVKLNDVVLTNQSELALDLHNDLEITFGDNQELSEANINIHYAGGHTHEEGETIREEEVVGTPFKYGPVIATLSGKSSVKSFHFEVPDTASAGDYHLEISVLDKSANKTTEVYTFGFGETEHHN
jgi:hypothetical protein